MANVKNFIESCRMLLRDGVIEHNYINGSFIRCTNYEDENIKIVKSMIDYSMNIIRKDSNTVVISFDRKGYISKIEKDWEDLASKLKDN